MLLFVNFFVDLCLLKVTSMLAGERIALRRFIFLPLVALPVAVFCFSILLRCVIFWHKISLNISQIVAQVDSFLRLIYQI